MSDEIDDLIEKLRTSHDGEREHAAKKLGELKDARAVGPLIKALGDADSLVQDNAMQALGKIGKPAVEPLIKALEYADSEVQWYAARIRGNAAYW